MVKNIDLEKIDAWNDGEENHNKGKTCDQLQFDGRWICAVCTNSYDEESKLRCDECEYNLCKVCAKEIVENTKKQRRVELNFNFKSLVPLHEEWRKSLREDFFENAEFGSEAQMEKFKGVMLKAKNTTQTKLQNLEKKIEGIESKMEGIENLMKKVAQKFN
jgi:hypothetical protein